MRERGLVVAILLLSSVFFVVSTLPGVSAKTLYVGGSGPGNYTTIQAAVDLASHEDVVFVFSGTYYENVIISKRVALIGEDRETTIIDGQKITNVISTDRSEVTVSGFTIRNSGTGWKDDAGIRAIGAPRSNFTNNIIVDNERGFAVVGGQGSLIDGNVIRRNRVGLSLEPYEITVSNNLIVDNIQGIDAYFFESSILANNTIVYNVYSVQLWYSAWDSRVYHNDILRNEIFPCDDSDTNLWDNGYPSGGNYWGHDCEDEMSGPEQDIPGSDGICDSWVWVPMCHWYGEEMEGDPPDRYPLVHSLRQIVLPPDKPRNLQATGGDHKATLTWDEPDFDGGSPVTGYSIYRGFAKYQETILIANVGNVTTYTDTGLVNGERYYYRVSARNANGEGPRGDWVKAEPEGLPGPPMDLTATAEDSRVILRWSHPKNDGGFKLTGYRIYRGTLPGEEEFLVELYVAWRYDDDGLENGVTYYYQLTAVNGAGEGPRSEEVNATPSTTPSAPRNLRATAQHVVKLEWDPPVDDGGSPITEYRVFRRAGFRGVEQIPFVAFTILPSKGGFIVSRVL